MVVRHRSHRFCAALLAFAFGLPLTAPQAQELGTIDFATSGATAAQPAFLEGVKALHSFQFDEAAVAFRQAKALDPSFALAYWGEAMSHNHPLWAQQDHAAAQQVLATLPGAAPSSTAVSAAKNWLAAHPE